MVQYPCQFCQSWQVCGHQSKMHKGAASMTRDRLDQGFAHAAVGQCTVHALDVVVCTGLTTRFSEPHAYLK